MDTITQGLLGAVTAQMGFRQRIGRDATWVAAATAILPDLDVFIAPLMALAGGEPGEGAVHNYHRGLSHSLLAVPIIAAVAAGMWWWVRRRLNNRGARHRGDNGVIPPHGGRGPPGFGLLYACCLVAVLSHPLLDWCTSYGTQLFAPLTSRRFAIDVVPIIDIFYTSLLILALAAAWLVRRVRPAARRAAVIVGWTGFVLSVGYLAAGRAAHDVTVSRSRALVPPGSRIVRADAYPTLASILLWRGVVETTDGWLAVRVRPLGHNRPRTKWAAKVDNQWVRRATELPEARRFKWFAMGRVRAKYELLDGRHVVELHDMRYGIMPEDVDSLWPLRVTFDDASGVIDVSRLRRHRRRDLGKFIKRLWKDMWAP